MISLPFGLGSIEINPDKGSRGAAWSMYVELATRVPVDKPQPARTALSREGSDRKSDMMTIEESLELLTELIEISRAILHEAGPDISLRRGSVGWIVLTTINRGMGPFLRTWRPIYDEWMEKRPADRSVEQHEDAWKHSEEIREALESVRLELLDLGNSFAKMAGIETAMKPN